jgi:hypothetical protein
MIFNYGNDRFEISYTQNIWELIFMRFYFHL